MPSRAWSLGASGPGKSGQTGPCGEEAARSARDTACRVPPPACCSPVGAPGLGSEAAPSERGLWGGPGAPAGCREVAGLVPVALFPTVLPRGGSSPGGWGGVGGALVTPWVSRALGLSDLLQRHYCPTLWPPIVLRPNLRLCHTHGRHTMTHMVTHSLGPARNRRRQVMLPGRPRAGAELHTQPPKPISSAPAGLPDRDGHAVSMLPRAGPVPAPGRASASGRRRVLWASIVQSQESGNSS